MNTLTAGHMGGNNAAALQLAWLKGDREEQQLQTDMSAIYVRVCPEAAPTRRLYSALTDLLLPATQTFPAT